jgi:hypothetical protein
VKPRYRCGPARNSKVAYHRGERPSRISSPKLAGARHPDHRFDAPAFDGFVDPCIPTPAAKLPAGLGWVHDIKHDGSWCSAA